MEAILLQNHSGGHQLSLSGIQTKNSGDDRHDVQFDEIMRVSYANKPDSGEMNFKNEHAKVFSKQINDSNLSIKFGDCSAVGGVLLTDKSLLFEDDQCGIN